MQNAALTSAPAPVATDDIREKAKLAMRCVRARFGMEASLRILVKVWGCEAHMPSVDRVGAMSVEQAQETIAACEKIYIDNNRHAPWVFKAPGIASDTDVLVRERRDAGDDGERHCSSVDLIGRVFNFNKLGQIMPPGQFNADRLTFYTGMQLEELGEKILAIAEGEVEPGPRERMRLFGESLDRMGKEFKEGLHMGAVLRADRKALLDADCDVLVVSAGALTYQTPHFVPALSHVLDRNDAKMPNGVVTRDGNGKIVKPEGWTPPDLSPFVVPAE